MSVTFKIQGDAKSVVTLTQRQLNKAFIDVALAWHAETTDVQLGKMVYNRIRGDDEYKLTGRLRASIAFVTPTMHNVHTYTHDGGSESYTPPKANGLEVLIGTNVEYAPAVHDGVNAQTVTVRAHTRRIKNAFGKPITPRTVQVNSHSRRVSARAARPFISQAGYNILPQIPGMITRILNEPEGT